jgi:hypothetical protein
MRAERKIADRNLAARARRSDVGRPDDHPRRRAGDHPCIYRHYRRTRPLRHLESARRASRPHAAGVSVGRDRQIGTNQQVTRPNAAAPPLRGRVGTDDPYPQVVSPAGLGCLRCQAPGHEAGRRRRGSQACCDMHRTWVTGDEFDFGGPAWLQRRRSRSDLPAFYRGTESPPFVESRATSSSPTRRWRERDSNFWSHLRTSLNA